MAVSIQPESVRTAAAHCLRIGLINNMPDEALRATERQYISLLSAASPGIQVYLSLYTLPGIPHTPAGEKHIASSYSSIEDLWNGHLDGLIVTGREPLAADLKEEPYWDSFTRTLSWARTNAHATVWSCLAAHAAVLHLDGIPRIRRSEKLFGIYRCTKINEHPFMAKAPALLEMPHSRWNSLPMGHLTEAGYTVLSRISEAEVDTFVKKEKKLFVFFQGHPEYEADTLLREYRRDISRFLKGETPRHPLPPQNYFRPETHAMLQDMQQRYASTRQTELPFALAQAFNKISVDNTWRTNAVGLYRNWLKHIRVQKNQEKRSKSAPSLPISTAMPTTSALFDTPAEA